MANRSKTALTSRVPDTRFAITEESHELGSNQIVYCIMASESTAMSMSELLLAKAYNFPNCSKSIPGTTKKIQQIKGGNHHEYDRSYHSYRSVVFSVRRGRRLLLEETTVGA